MKFRNDLSAGTPQGISPGRFWTASELEKVRGNLTRLTDRAIRDDPATIIIKENRHRAIYKVKVPLVEFPLLIKSFYYPSPVRKLKGVLAPYGSRELSHALEALKREIPIPKPLFFMRRRSGLKVSDCLLGYRYLEGISLYDLLSGGELLPERRERLMRAAGRLTALLHERGGNHRDYHAGNLLVLRDDELVLVDLYPLTFTGRLPEGKRIEGLAHLVASIYPYVGSPGTDELLKGYREVSSFLPDQAAVNTIMKRSEALKRRHEASRAKRCMKNSSEFYQFRGRGVRIAARRELTVEKILSILERFERDFHARPADALKNAPESVILRMKDAWDIPLCVKWYRKRGMADRLKEVVRGGRVLRAWKAGNALLARGFRVATPFAMVKTSRGGFLLMEAAQGKELDRILDGMLQQKDGVAFREKAALAEALGTLIGRLHEKGIFHADLKACNLMVSRDGERWEIKLLDYDNVKVFRNLPEKMVVKNLVQLNTSIPGGVSRGFRFRFFRAYAACRKGLLPEKDLFRKVWEVSRHKAIVYVTDGGDREETWRH